MSNEAICYQHGRQGIGLVCVHIAYAIDSGRQVGFFWGDDTDAATPDAWCANCEQALRAVPAGQPTDGWFRSCDFKVFCAACWDHAKSVLYERRQTTHDGQ